MGSKKQGKKKPHEMMRETAIYEAWQRLIRGGLDKKLLSPEHALNTAVDVVTEQLYANLLKNKKFHSNGGHFYECMDSCVAHAILLCSLSETDEPVALLDELSEIFELLRDTLLDYFKGLPPGFEPLGDGAAAAFSSFFKGHVNLTVAVVNWLIAGKHIYTLSNTLSQMLQHTKLDRIKAKHIRLPFRTVYISPPKNTWESLPIPENERGLWGITADDVDGVLITEHEENGQRSLSFTVLGFVKTRTGRSIMGLDKHTRVQLNDEQTLAEILDTQLGDVPSIFQEIFRYVTSVAIYVTSKDADQILASASPEYASWIKEMQRYPPGHKERKAIDALVSPARSTQTYYLGNSLKINRHLVNGSTAADTKGTHASPVPHYRSGHFRAQPYGTKDAPLYKTIWIQPQIIGMSSDAVKDTIPRSPAIREVS